MKLIYLFCLLFPMTALFGQLDSICLNGVNLINNNNFVEEVLPNYQTEVYESEIDPGVFIKRIYGDSIAFFYTIYDNDTSLISAYATCNRCMLEFDGYDITLGDSISTLFDRYPKETNKYLNSINPKLNDPENWNKIDAWRIRRKKNSDGSSLSILIAVDDQILKSFLVTFQ